MQAAAFRWENTAMYEAEKFPLKRFAKLKKTIPTSAMTVVISIAE